MDRDIYAAMKLQERSSTAVYDHFQQYGAKFGLYYEIDGMLTAQFCSIGGKRKDWRTNDESFKSLVDEVVQHVPAG